MRTLFLGLGKVTKALASVREGTQFGFVETDNSLQIFEGQRGEFRLIHEVPGNFESYDFSSYLPADVFLSPGIDPRRKFFEKLRPFEIRELDYVSSKFQGKIIGITGTDGKSTLTTHLGEVLRRGFPEKSIFVGGNLGTPMAEVLKKPYDLAVLEVSSFQCERLKTAEIEVGILLNLAVDHLDRYENEADYYRAKWNLLEHSRQSFHPVDLHCPVSLTRPNAASYSNDVGLSEILSELAPKIFAQLGGKTFRSEWLQNLPLLPHRLEIYVADGGRIFVDDSKATTVHAALYGLKEMQKQFSSIWQIVGGRHKGDDFGDLASGLRSQDVLLICGEAREIIQEQIGANQFQCRVYRSLKSLLEAEVSTLPERTCLLLSPGCSSYDEFENFEERGDFFVAAAKKSYPSVSRKRQG